jgi:hypothetical protein
LDEKLICYYDSQEFNNFGSGAYWKNTTKFVIKFIDIIFNIMNFSFKLISYGVTKLKGINLNDSHLIFWYILNICSRNIYIFFFYNWRVKVIMRTCIYRKWDIFLTYLFNFIFIYTYFLIHFLYKFKWLGSFSKTNKVNHLIVMLKIIIII